MQPQNESMAIALWFKPTSEAIESYGIDSIRLLTAAGVDEDSMSDPWKFYPVSIRNRVFQMAVEETGDACFGLRVAEFMRPPMMGHLGYSLLASSTLLAMFSRLERFFQLVSMDGEHRVEEVEDGYRVNIIVLEPSVSFEAMDAWMGVLTKLCRDMYSPNFSPIRLEFVRPSPGGCAKRMEEWFGCPINFSSDRLAMYIDAAAIHAKLPGAVRELARAQDEVLASFLVKHRKADILTRTKVLIADSLPSGDCSKELSASQCNISARTLQNKLGECGVTYAGLLDSVREQLALSYVRQPHHNRTEITYLLGFRDSSSFSRAFKRWTGIPPSEFEREGGVGTV